MAFAALVSASGIVFFWPRVDVQIAPTLDVTTPFENRFTLQNGLIPLRNVWYVMEWTPGDGTPVVFASSAFAPISTLGSHEKVTLQFPHLDDRASFPFYAGAGQRSLPEDRAFARIRLFYAWPGFKSVHVTDKYFYTIKDRAGNFQWFHNDSDHPWTGGYLPKFADHLNSRRLREIDVMAFLDVGQVAVDNISENDSARPLQIRYTLRNIGGIPATDADIEWAVLDVSTLAIRHAWTNRTPIVATKEIVLPKMLKMVAARYPDPKHPELFDGIISGKFMLAGRVRFKDVHVHDYTAIIKAVYSGGTLAVRYLHVEGYFQEVKKLAVPQSLN